MVSQLIPDRRGLSLCAVLAVLSTLALALPSAGRAVVNIEGHTPAPLPDYDSRASAAPTADQLAAATALGVDVSWNRFGVASAVSNNGAYITKNIQASDATSAARAWLDANKLLFKLDSTASLVAVDSSSADRNDERLRGRVPPAGRRSHIDRRRRDRRRRRLEGRRLERRVRVVEPHRRECRCNGLVRARAGGCVDRGSEPGRRQRLDRRRHPGEHRGRHHDARRTWPLAEAACEEGRFRNAA